MEIETSLPPLFCSKHGNAALSLCFSENCSDPVLCLSCFYQIAASVSSTHKEHNFMPVTAVEAQIKQTNEVNIDPQYAKLKENLSHLVKKHSLISKSIVNAKDGLIGDLHKADSHNIVSMVNHIMRLNQTETTLNEETQKHFDQVEAQLAKLEEQMDKVPLLIKDIHRGQTLLANSVLSKESEEDKSSTVNTKEFEEVNSSRMTLDERINKPISFLVESSLLNDPVEISDDEHRMDHVENNAEAVKEEYSDHNHDHNSSILKDSQLIAVAIQEENEDALENDSGDKVKTSQHVKIPTVSAQLPSLTKASRRYAKTDSIEDIGSKDSEEEDKYRQGPKIIKKRGNPKNKPVMIGSSDLFGQVLSTNAKSIKCLTQKFKTSELKLLDEKPSSFTIAAMDGENPSLLFTSSIKAQSNDKVSCYELNQSLELIKLRDVSYRDPSAVKERIKIMTTIRFRTETYMMMLGERMVDKSQLYLVKTNGIIACKMVIDSNVNCMDYFHEYLFLGTDNGMKIYQIIITTGESISLKRSGINLETMKALFERQGYSRLSRFHILQSDRDRENSQDGAFNIQILCYYSTAQMLVLHTLSVTYFQNNWVLSGPCSKSIDTDIDMTSASKKDLFFIGFGSTLQDPDVVYCFTKGEVIKLNLEIIKLNLASPERYTITKLPNIVELQDFKMITLNGGEKDKKRVTKTAVNIKFILLDVNGCLVMDYVDNKLIVKESKFKYDVKWDNYFPKSQLLFRSSQDFRLLVLDKNSTLQEILLEAAN